MAKPTASAQAHRFPTAGEAHRHARHYARYAHRTFLVWSTPEGEHFAAPVTVEHLEMMLSGMDEDAEPCTYYGDVCTIIGRRIGEIMLANGRVGVFV